MKSSCFCKIAGVFLAKLSKMNKVKGIFQGFLPTF